MSGVQSTQERSPRMASSEMPCLCASVPQRLSPAGTPPAARAQAHACEAANTGLRARGALYYLRGKCWELGSSRR